MKNAFSYHLKSLALALGVAVFAASSAHAQDSGALIDALVKKGVLSDQEAEDIRTDLTKEYNTTSAGKIEISSFISHLQLYGDARLRYQYQNVRSNTDFAGPSGGPEDESRNRYRYRLRLGALYTYDAHWSAGVRLETGTSASSNNEDFGRYFDKYGSELNVELIYLEYKNKFSLFDGTTTVADGKNFKTVTDPGIEVGVDARIGKHPKQILLSEAFWDPDTNPAGVSEEFTFSNVGVDGLSFAARGGEYLTSAPNTATAPVGSTGTGALTAAVNSQGAGTTAYTGIASNNTAALLVAQIEGKYAWSSNANVRIAPLYMDETPGAIIGAGGALQEQNSNNSLGITPAESLTSQNPYAYLGRFEVAAVPVEVNWKAWGKPMQVWGTYGANLEGGDRLRALGFANEGGQNTFWNAGYQIGQSKVKGDWLASIEWRWIEAASYDTNLSESDWANNGLNQQGFVLRGGYQFTDAVSGLISFYHSNPINSNANNPGASPLSYAASDIASGNTSAPFEGQVDIIEADLNWKF